MSASDSVAVCPRITMIYAMDLDGITHLPLRFGAQGPHRKPTAVSAKAGLVLLQLAEPPSSGRHFTYSPYRVETQCNVPDALAAPGRVCYHCERRPGADLKFATR